MEGNGKFDFLHIIYQISSDSKKLKEQKEKFNNGS